MKAFDMWQIGMILGILIGGALPYHSKSQMGEERYYEARKRFLEAVCNKNHTTALEYFIYFKRVNCEEYGASLVRDNCPIIYELFQKLVSFDLRTDILKRLTIDQVVEVIRPSSRSPPSQSNGDSDNNVDITTSGGGSAASSDGISSN